METLLCFYWQYGVFRYESDSSKIHLNFTTKKLGTLIQFTGVELQRKAGTTRIRVGDECRLMWPALFGEDEQVFLPAYVVADF